MRRKKQFIAFALLTLLIISMNACGKQDITPAENPPAEETSGSYKDQIVQALFVSPSGVFNPIYADSDYDIAVNNIVFSTLLALDSNKEIIPSLAESYDISDDSKTITFHLREGVKWHDGTPFTSEDVAFTLNKMADPEYIGPLYGSVETIVGAAEVKEGKAETISGVEIVDAQTIRLTYSEVFAPALIRVGTEVGIIAKHIWEKVPVKDWKNSTDLMNQPIGTGPYKFEKYVPGQYVELKRNEEYFNGQPKTASFVFKITNQDTAVAALTNGEIDIADISNFKPSDIKELESSGISVVSFPGKSYQYMGFNMREKVFEPKELRQAITYAIDRKTVIEQLLGGNGTIINAPMLPDTWQYPKDGINKYEFDPEKAKALLKQIGYEDRDGDGIVEDGSGQKLSLSLKYPLGNKIREQYATVIKKYLADIGIETELLVMEFSTLLEETMSNHEFEMYLMGSSLSLDPDPIPYWSTDASSDEKGVAAWNIPAYRDAESDELMRTALHEMEQSKRAELYQRFSARFNENPPIVLLYAPNIIKAYNPKLKNYKPVTFVDYYDIENWVIEN